MNLLIVVFLYLLRENFNYNWSYGYCRQGNIKKSSEKIALDIIDLFGQDAYIKATHFPQGMRSPEHTARRNRVDPHGQ